MPCFLPKSVGQLHKLAAQSNDTRYAMSGVLIDPGNDPEDYWRLVATDGKVLAIVQGPNDKANGLTRPTLEHDAPQDSEACVVIPGKDWQAIFSTKASLGQCVGVVPTLQEIALACCGHRLRSLPVEGAYPNYMGVLPKRVPLMQFVVDPKLLARLCQVISSMQDASEQQKVTFCWYGPQESLGLMARGLGGVTIDALLMPIIESK